MPLQWNQNLSVGVEEIDNQHKELFERVNALISSMTQGKGKSELNRLVDFLDDYVKFHFGTEESYMNKYNYSDYVSHKSFHTEFIKDLDDFKKELEAQGTNSYLTIKIQKWLCDWLINHISNTDKALGTYLKTKI